MMTTSLKTSAEKRLAALLKKKKLTFIQNTFLEGYEIDFFLPGFKMAIEVDGFSHLSAVKRRSDLQKDRILGEKGIIVFRITNHQIRQDPNTCLNAVEDYIRRFKATQSFASINQDWKKSLNAYVKPTKPDALTKSTSPQTIEEYFLSLEDE